VQQHPELGALIASWPALSEAVRARILELAEGAQDEGAEA
jgi:hypothetical protein